MKIDRPNIDIQPFAGGSKTEERTAFGSKEITDNLEKNLNADFARGWGIVPVSELPTMQDFNAVGFTISSLVTHLYQNGIAEYAEKQIYNKGAVCLSEGNIYISKTENNAGNPLTDTTQWQSLKDAILTANIVQQIGNATDKVMSQKSVTDALNTKQVKGDYATKTDLTQGLNTKLNSSAVKQTTGNSTTDVMSQKACNDNYAKKDSQEPFSAGGIEIKSGGNYSSLTLIKGSGDSLLLETSPTDACFVYRDTKNNNKAVVTIPSAKNGTLALTDDVDAINNYPVGAPIPWPQASPPKGYLICNGKPFDKAKYPKLAQAYPSGRLPELRGEFIRGLSVGRDGVDVGRTVLSAQGDAIRNIKGTFKGSAGRFNPEYVTGVFKLESMNAVGAGHGNYNELGKVSFDPSRVVPTANENRPRNVAFLYIVRAA